MYQQQQQQQHQHQHVPFTQPYYSANPVLLPFPLTTDSSDYHNWILKQPDPITYDHAVGPSNGTWSHQFFTNEAVALPNQTKFTKPIRCEVCKIDCNSKDVYEKHISGKKHQKNLQVQTNPSNTLLAGGSSHLSVQSHPTRGKVSAGSVGKELKSKEQKLLNGSAPADSVKFCTVCNIVCTSQDVYDKHLAGKKHAAQVGLMSNNGIGPYIAAFKRQGIGPWKKAPKKVRVDQSAWCEVCEIKCNSRDMYIIHLSGKKHMKNLEKLSKPKLDANASATTTKALQLAANPIIRPQEKQGTEKPKSQKASEMNIEMKKLKVVEGGAAASAVRICILCNVVCNSQTVFDAHLVGHKHTAMMKKQGESIAAPTG
ncbi:hypothetical protein RJT34_12358 [Clitoria ternatea]|uniref:Uncharacterized protein n=1 Tax=Clitoria ternatea TaxID=43366 RepID=A0AAN9JLZ8_CLITE